MKRPYTFEQAKARYVNRFTMEHVPAWAKTRMPCGKYCAPQYATDLEWYEKVKLPGESPFADKFACFSTDPSWPLGKWLDEPYSLEHE